jgi:hypothetical protein
LDGRPTKKSNRTEVHPKETDERKLILIRPKLEWDMDLEKRIRDIIRGCLVGKNFLDSGTVAFCFIWQLLFNHGLIRLKRFVSRFHGELCN